MLGTMSEKLDSLIIIDRRVDMITPLLTQLTYEGLVDELIGIKNCESQCNLSQNSADHLTPQRTLNCRCPCLALRTHQVPQQVLHQLRQRRRQGLR